MTNKSYDDYKEIINDLCQKFEFPFMKKESSSLHGSYEYRMKEYIIFFKNKTDNENCLVKYVKSNIEILTDIKNYIKKTIEAYLAGKPGDAYATLSELLSKPIIDQAFDLLLNPMSRYGSKGPGPEHALYRARVSDHPIELPNDIFHIPFDKRYLVESQRYSIAGVPSLYLGSSLYDCWREMGKPDLNKLYVSKFKFNDDTHYNDMKYLDLSYAFQHEYFKHFRGHGQIFGDDFDDEKIKAKLLFWPIIAACSFSRPHINAKFNEEYIIPNLLLQWISTNKEKVFGLKYFSVKYSLCNHSYVGTNFVFITDTSKVLHKGQCNKLSNIFLVSKPVSWQLLKTINNDQAMCSNHSGFSFSQGQNFEESLISQYEYTDFSRIERILVKMKAEEINKNNQV